MKLSTLTLSGIALTAAFGSDSVQHLSLHDRSVTTTHSEQLRLRSHFDSVDLELRRADTSALSDTQRAARRQIIAWLKDYRDAGLFPRNERFADAAMPFFRDSRGTLCAMAWLVARSGRQGIVDRIARSRNNALIHELADDRELVRWVDSVGLTLGEAARIQPNYQFSRDSRVDADYALGSLIVSGMALTTAGLNAFAPSNTSGWVGIVTGGVATVTGLVALALDAGGSTDGSGRQKLAVANLVVGLTSMGLGIHGLEVAGHKPSEAATRGQAGRNATIAFTPAVRSGSRGMELGLAIRRRF